MKTLLSIAVLALLAACGGGSGGASSQEEGASQAASSVAGDGPDTSGLGAIILGKINEDPSRQEQKATARLLDFKVVSVKTEAMGEEASAVVECAGTVEFDADAFWGMDGLQKAGEPARFECQAEYVRQGDDWQMFGPMGIYPL